MSKNPQTKTTKAFRCQPGPDYPFLMKQFGKKKRSFSWFHYSKEKDSVFCIFCIRHKGELTAEHNMQEAFITKGSNDWKKALEAFVDHQQSKAHRAAITYESVVPQCGNVLVMTVNDLSNKRLAERKYLIKVMKCIRFLARQ